MDNEDSGGDDLENRLVSTNHFRITTLLLAGRFLTCHCWLFWLEGDGEHGETGVWRSDGDMWHRGWVFAAHQQRRTGKKHDTPIFFVDPCSYWVHSRTLALSFHRLLPVTTWPVDCSPPLSDMLKLSGYASLIRGMRCSFFLRPSFWGVSATR